MSDTELHQLSVDELEAAYRAKRLSPVDVTDATLSRIAMHNDAVNAFVVIDADEAMFSARASGIPVGARRTPQSNRWRPYNTEGYHAGEGLADPAWQQDNRPRR